MKYLSLCLPTNGIIEWVMPAIEAIMSQQVNTDEWELVITDNGNSDEFLNKMQEYERKYSNIKYKRTNAILFENQIEALKLAEGSYLKFVNHRSILKKGALQWMVDCIKANIDEKPIIYFSNGLLKKNNNMKFYTFNEFVKGLRELASWTSGVGVWKKDFETIPNDWKYNAISPHSDVLFWVRDRKMYVIDDKIWFHDIESGHEKKGKYDLYRAFACEEISITLELYNNNSISSETLKYVIRCYEDHVASLYAKFNILKEKCSYNLNGFDEAMDIFLNKKRVIKLAYFKAFKMIIKGNKE